MSDDRNTHDGAHDGPWRELENQLASVDECEPRDEFESELRRRFVTGFEDAPARGAASRDKPSRSGGTRIQLWALTGMAAAVLVAVGWWFGQRDGETPGPRDDIAQEGSEQSGSDDGTLNDPDAQPITPQLETRRPGDQLVHDDNPAAPDVAPPLDATPAHPSSRGWSLAATDGELSGPERRPLERGLRDGTVVDVDERAIDIELDGGWSLRALPGARFVAEALPVERADGPAQLRLLAGEVLIRTPRDYAGPAIQIGTPHTDVTVVGTALSIMTQATGTCVCVSHGTVAVAPKDERPQESVVDRQTCYVFADGAPRYLGGFNRPDGGLMGEYEGAHLAPLLAFDVE